MWYYRIAKKYTLIQERKKICNHTRKEHQTPKKDKKGRVYFESTHTCYRNTGRMKKNPFYCVVEFFPKRHKRGPLSKPIWSTRPQAPIGDTRAEVIQSLEMMLKDAKHYRTLIEKTPTPPEAL